jgi:magnesium-transporting ATPase (P-type)
MTHRRLRRQSVVETLRDGSWLALQSGGLVHGDLITLDDNQVRRAPLARQAPL